MEVIDNKYRILDTLGQGGFGKVYKVEDVYSKKTFALKVCTENDEIHRKRFAREVRIMKNIDNENIIKIIDYNLDSDPPYFLMPLAESSLKNKIHLFKSNHTYALSTFLEICLGIQTLHTNQIIHRDIKPENILIFEDGSIVVSDLGLGKFENRDSTILTGSRIYLGTEGYIPPEYKMEGGTKNADARGDVYQLGKLFYYILTGEYPTLIQNNLLPPSLTYIIQKATKERSAERFQSVGEFIDAINSYNLAIDPNSNPIEKFEANINALHGLVKQGQYDKKILDEILQIIFSMKDESSVFFDLFDKLPNPVLDVYSNQFANDFEPILQEYTGQLLDYLGSEKFNFSYAETITNKMRRIYVNTNKLDFKVLALKNILISSVYFNRFAAMDIFIDLILSIKDNDEAVAISEMLRQEADWFEGFQDSLPNKKLHIALQQVCVFVEQRKKERENKDRIERQNADW